MLPMMNLRRIDEKKKKKEVKNLPFEKYTFSFYLRVLAECG